MITILSLNESSIPQKFTASTIVGKEARLRLNLPTIDRLIVVSRPPSNGNLKSPPSNQPALAKIQIIHTLPWPYYLSPLILFFYGLYACLKFKPSWIEAESPIYSGPAAILLGWLFRLKTIIEIRSDFADLTRFRFNWLPLKFKQSLTTVIQNFSLNHSAGIIANSRSYARQFVPIAKPAGVINPGIEVFPATSSAYQVSPPQFQLGYLGRLVPEKGVALLIHAIASLIHSSNMPAFHLSIAGQGPSEVKLKKLVAKHRLEKYINFVGFQPSRSFLKTCHLLINPCLVNAPLEMVNVEAAALGIPVICFGQASSPETVLDHQTGLKVYPYTVSALAQTIQFFLNHSRLRLKLHQRGPIFAKTHYDFSQQSQILGRFYRRLRLI